jgi:hypothetical protein
LIGKFLGGDKVLSPPSKRIPLAFALIFMRRFSAQIGRFATDLHVHRLPVYPVIYHRICLFKCQNLAACAATDFDAQKQIPLWRICFLRGTRPRKNDLLTQINLNRFSRPLRGNRKA